MKDFLISLYRLDFFSIVVLFICSISLLCFAILFYFLSKKKQNACTQQEDKKTISPEITRHKKNPIISPCVHNEWENQGTFNPAVWRDEQGMIHLVYRAVGADGISRLGYAYSSDGEHFERLHYPIYEAYNLRNQSGRSRVQFNPLEYPSGGSGGGVEDPRIVAIDDRLYITCSAFDGWDFIRCAVLSIDKKDFLEKKWKWSRIMLISPEGKINKNWVLFPEKINGRFAILHSISPRVQIDYVHDLEALEKGIFSIQSNFSQNADRQEWDTRLRGIGAPPLRTEYGWLVLYHATTKEEPHKYKIGAMILDYSDPEKVIARSPGPLFGPDMWYENDYKAGVVYVCGAYIANKTLYVYYGGGDKHVCVAHVPEHDIMKWIMKKGDYASA